MKKSNSETRAVLHEREQEWIKNKTDTQESDAYGDIIQAVNVLITHTRKKKEPRPF